MAPERPRGRGRDVLGTAGVGEIEDAGAADERDSRHQRCDTEVPRCRLNLAQELLHELRTVCGEHAVRVLGQRDGAEPVDRRDPAGAVLRVHLIEARLGHELQRAGLEPERVGGCAEPRLVTGRLRDR